MTHDSITDVLGIQGFFSTEVKISQGRIDIWLGRDPPVYQCPRCGQLHWVAHDLREVTVQDLPMSGRAMYLHFEKARVKCCGRQPEIEHLAWVEKNSYQTVRLKWRIYEECSHASVSAVARWHAMSWDTAKRIDKEMIEIRLSKRDLSGLQRLGIDEVSLTKGQKYLTVVTDLQARKVVWVGKGRKSRNLSRFFKLLSEATRRSITVVVIDMWEAYRKSVKKHLPNATIVFDKFHIIGHLNKALDEVRKEEARRLEKDERKVLKRKRWVLLKGAENLSPREQGTLEELCEANQALHKAYLLKEDFREFYRLDFAWRWRRGWTTRILELARNYLGGWLKRARQSLLPPLEKFCKMVEKHEEGILHYFVKRVTGGLSEGMNNKIKAIKKRAYGYRDPEYFILKIYQACGKI